MDISMLDRMSRRELQSLAKTLAIPANQKSELIIEAIKSRSHTEANSSSAVTRDSEPLDDQDFFSLPQPPSVSSPNISLIPFKASQLVESPTLIIKPAATPLRPSSPDRMRKETTTGKTPLTGRSMSVARRVPIDQPRPQQRSQTPNRSSFPSRPLTPSSQTSHLAQRPKTPARTAFGGRTEPTTPRASGMIQPSHHRPLTPRSQCFGGAGVLRGQECSEGRSAQRAGVLRPSTPGRNQTPVRNQTPGRKSVAGTFPLSPRPSAPHAQGPWLNKPKGQENDAKVTKVGEMLAIRASDLPFPAEIKLKMRKALLPSTNSSRFILMHSSESGLSSKEVGSAIVSSIAGELVKKQGNVAFPQRQKPVALYYDLRKALSDENSAKASADIKSLLKGLGSLSSTLPNRQPSQSILILDGLETLRENQRLDMDSAMNACEASSALIEGLDLFRKSRFGGGGGGGGSKENAPGLAPVIVVLVRSSGQSLESCVDENIVKRMTGGVIHLDKLLKDVFLPAPPPPPVRASTIVLPSPTPQPLQLVKVSPHPAIKEIACSDEEREEWLVMRLMEIEAALGVEDVEQLVKLTAGLSVNGLSKLFSQALEKSKCKDGLADVLFFSHFESILMI